MAKKTFYKKIIQLQNFLLSRHLGALSHIFKGLKIIKKTFYYQEKPTGFLKARINIAHCTLIREQVIELYNYRMMDFIVFSRPEEVYYFREKFQIVIGNITISETVQAQFFYSIPPKKLWVNWIKHRIFVVPI